MTIERNFDVGFVARLSAEEKQIQQYYRPVIGVHKWFARRPGALFRSLLLSEFGNGGPLFETYFQGQSLDGVTIGDPFMGGGTTLFEGNRMGCNVVGFDINPMAYWVVRQELVPVDREIFRREAENVLTDVARVIDGFYRTRCECCSKMAPVKYFLWVKAQPCGACGDQVDLFPGYLVAGNSRHTHFLFHCPECRTLVQFEERPGKGERKACPSCSHRIDWSTSSARRNRYLCKSCGHEGRYPHELAKDGPPEHRLFGIEYHCSTCRPGRRGRFFKTAEASDLARFTRAAKLLDATSLDIPDEEIPDGDETKRLHRWGYRRYREMFNERQLLGLGLVMQRIKQVEDAEARHALATVFSDFLRYQNMLCRYDTYALKCQDIFSVHGFPVGLVQCENNVLGIPRVGSGSFCHFVEKYDRAKKYCEAPFETVRHGRGRKTRLHVVGERIAATLVDTNSLIETSRGAMIGAGTAEDATLPPLDGVFTDPPYFDNVQYAELMDFCFVWLRRILNGDIPAFANASTRSERELTGNTTTGKGLEHFTEGLSRVFVHTAAALRPGSPFVFTYHHNDIDAYVPVVVALLDARLSCTATLPAAAEMTASLHINGTGSSIVDTVLVCRKQQPDTSTSRVGRETLRKWLLTDRKGLAQGNVKCSAGDLFCLALGHLARVSIAQLYSGWHPKKSTGKKMETARKKLHGLYERTDVADIIKNVLEAPLPDQGQLTFSEVFETTTGDHLGDGPNRKHLATGR